jgi:hypothetical protein
VLSRSQEVSAEKLLESVEVLRALNPDVAIFTTTWTAGRQTDPRRHRAHGTLAKEIEALRADADDVTTTRSATIRTARAIITTR